jgi:hypothetical protein
MGNILIKHEEYSEQGVTVKATSGAVRITKKYSGALVFRDILAN